MLEAGWPDPWIVLGGALCLLVIIGGSFLVRQNKRLESIRKVREHQAEQLRALELLDALAENSDDCMYVKDTEGRYLLFNRAACAMVGKSQAEVLGRDCFAIFPAEDATELARVDKEVVANDCRATSEVCIATVQGPRTFHVTKGPLHDAKGKIIGVFGTSRDITERIEAENRLKASKQQFHDLVDTTDGIVWEADARSFDFTYVSQKAERLLGFPVADWSQPGFWAEHIHPDDTVWAVEYCVAHTAQLKPHDFEYRFIARDGRTIWLHDIVTVATENGQPRWLRGIMIDVTERKRRDELLLKLSLAVEQSPDSIIITDIDANIEYVNEAFIRNTGYGLDEVIGKNPNLLRSGQTPRETYRSMWASLSQGQAWKGEFINRRKDGSDNVELSIIAPIRQTDGKISHYVAISEDITERKRMGHELDQHRHNLEELVARRTLQLEEARQRAEVATRAKSAFLANVSHEILTPMNAILGLTHILRRGLPTPEQADKLGKIAAAAEHLLSIINNVLDLSRIETGKLVLANTNFSLESVLNHTRSMIAETARIKGIALNVDCAGLPSWLRGDPTRLRQALLIFAGNAVKFTHHGSISLRARLVEANDRGAPEAATGDAEDKLLIRFEVEDTGVGIPADKLSGLFQPFVQVDASSTRKYGGTGIGLAISRLLATEMGGDVGVESQVGRGSTFWMTARLSRGQDVAPPVLAPADLPANSSAESLLRHHHRNALVLLAEDNEISQETTLELIYAVGLNADTAANGREAVARAATVPYDLILMNTRMPLLNGLDAAREIRAQASTAATPILAITASDFDNDRVACQEAGINDFIHKPISPSMFYDTLLKWLPKPAPPSAVVEQTHDMPANKENLQQRLTAIRGLDLESGLAILRGDVGKYARLLKLFADSYRNRSKLIHGALAKGEIASLESIAHSLRGSASMLGAQSVSETANSVLLAVRGGQMDDAARFGAVLAEQLSTLIDDILHAVSDSPEADEPAPIHTRLPIVLAQLEEHLAHGDLAATYLATEEAPLLRAVLGEAAQSLIGHIDAFEYEEAATELSRILRQLNAVPIESAPPSPEGTR